jgi:DNA-directed RNA polymerase subunit RPC12/RpoP
MAKKLIKLTESDLRRIIKESVNRILKEGYYDFDDDFNADDVECPYCGSNNVEPISAIDTHYRCLDCGEEFYLDGGWEPDWGAMRHESHKRKGKNINEATTPTWKRWQGYTPDQKAERLAYMQQQIAQLKQQREYAKQKTKTARTPEEQQTWRNTKAQIDRELLRVVSHEHDLRVGKKMTQGAKERATIKRREDRAKEKNRITFQPQDDPYYVSESSNQFLKEDVDYGMPPYTVVVGGLREGQPFDDIYEAIEYAEQWHSYITNSGEHENITIYDGNDEDVWSVGHFR